jgi:hypothetical protein
MDTLFPTVVLSRFPDDCWVQMGDVAERNFTWDCDGDTRYNLLWLYDTYAETAYCVRHVTQRSDGGISVGQLR